MSAFVHMELSTTDPKRAVDFYKKLFGWKFDEMKMPDGGLYTGFRADGGPGGGIQAVQMPGQPSAWLPYVSVKSVKTAMAKAKSLGATAVVEHMPIPNFGALGIFTDPTGASLAFWEASAPAPEPKPKQSAKKPAAKKPAAKKPPAPKKKPAPKRKR
jgi:uncharacterized protein